MAGFNLFNGFNFGVNVQFAALNLGSIGLGSSSSPDVTSMFQTILAGIL